MREVYLWSPRQSQTSPAQLGVQSSWCFARFTDGQRMVRSDQSFLEYNTHVEWTWDVGCFLQPHQVETSLGLFTRGLQ